MAEDLGRIDIEKVKKTPQEAIQEFMQLSEVARPSSIITRPQEITQSIQNRAEKQSFMERMSMAMLAGSDALTGGDLYKTKIAEGIARDKLSATKDKPDVEIYQIDPITGDPKVVGTAPYGSKIYKGVLSPDQMKERAVASGEASAVKTDIETSQKLAGAVKRLGILNKQFGKALPTGDKTPIEQRIGGGISSWAAKTGLVNNPELVGLQKNIRPIAINMIRAFGEVGNLSESEQKGAIDVVEQSGLTEKERIAATKQFIEYAIAGARPESMKLLKDRKDIQGILDAFGVSLNGDSAEENDYSKMSDEQLKKIVGGK